MTNPSHNFVSLLAEVQLPPEVKAVGVTRHDAQAALLVIVREQGVRAFGTDMQDLFGSVSSLPLVMREVSGDLYATGRLPVAQTQALTPEQEVLEPVVLGAQVQNGSADERLGGYGVGTLGAFAQDAEGRAVLLSNNHVIAAENDAEVGDVIFQAQRERGRAVGKLAEWVPITLTEPNRVDIASATVDADAAFENGFLPLRNRPDPAGVAAPRIGAKVFKVGRTSGLTFGSVTTIATRVPSVGYGIGSASFENSFIIEGQGGSTFSAPGDSGSGIYDMRGRLVGFLYAGDGTITLACPAGEALSALSLTLD